MFERLCLQSIKRLLTLGTAILVSNRTLFVRIFRETNSLLILSAVNDFLLVQISSGPVGKKLFNRIEIDTD